MYDYIVVGAGLYGKLIAYKLSKETNKILLIDKKDITKKNKLNYIVINEKANELLNSLVENNIEPFISKKIDNVIINKENYDVKKYILDLKKFESYLLDNYLKNKGKILNKAIIKNYDFNNSQLVITGRKYKYKKLIAADGTMSEIRINLTKKIQRFMFCAQLKCKKSSNDYIINYNNNTKLFEEVIPIRTNNYIKIINHKFKNNIFSEIINLKNKYKVDYKTINGYFIPKGDLLFNKRNIYFLGDSSGIIDPINYSSIIYNLKIIDNFNKYKKKDYKKIKRILQLKKIISKLLYLPIINRLIISLMIKFNWEELW